MLTLERSKIVCLGKEAFCISYNTTRQKSQECFSLRIFLNELFFIAKGETRSSIETFLFLVRINLEGAVFDVTAPSKFIPVGNVILNMPSLHHERILSKVNYP